MMPTKAHRHDLEDVIRLGIFGDFGIAGLPKKWCE